MSTPPLASPAAEPPLAPGDNAALLRRLLGVVWHYRTRCLRVIATQIVLLTLGLSGLSLVGVGIDYLRHAVDPIGTASRPVAFPLGWQPPADWAPLVVMLAIGGGILGLAALRSLLNHFYSMDVAHLVQSEIVPDLRAKVYDKLQRLSWRFFDGQSTGSIINRVTGDVQSVRLFVDGVFIQAFIMVLSLAVYFIFMARIHLPLTMACLASTPLFWIFSAWFSRTVRPAYDRNRDLMDGMVREMAENIQGIQTIKSFSREEAARTRFAERNAEVRDQRATIFWLVSTFGPGIAFLTQFNLFVLFIYGGWLVIHDELALGTGIVVFAGLLQQFSGQIANISGLVDSAQQSLAGARRVFEILDAPIEVQSPPHPVRLGKVRGEIAFEAVDFDYTAGNSVLREVSFTVPPGQMVAIVGATGSGKSALMSLIPRFHDPKSGTVRLDGHDLRTLDLEELRRSVGIVFQESFLFSNTVRANIAFGFPEATDAQVIEAAKIAQAHDFIMAMPKGYDSLLTEGGSNLSGGQRQRLAIARAIVRQPPILLLDDPTAAIDPETEHEILDAIENAIVGRTTFIVAHRLSTLRRAHRIIVLDRGRIVQSGTHEELMAKPGPYRRAATIQIIDPLSLRLLKETAARRKAAAIAQPNCTAAATR